VRQHDELPNLKKIQNSPALWLPLYLRAQAATGANSLALPDPKAVEILKCLELEPALGHDCCLNAQLILTRTLIIDHAVKRFLKKNTGVVINLGAGLDTRLARLKRGDTYWYEVDIPEIIEFRRCFFKDAERVRFLAASLLDNSWIEAVATTEETPVLLVAEGLLPYLSVAETGSLLQLLAVNFPQAEMYFDVAHRRLTGQGLTPFKWGLDKAREIEQLYHGIKLVEHWSIKDFPSDRKQLWNYLRSFLNPVAKKRLQVLRVSFNKIIQSTVR
jgi:O-methyltransferase involved in polyketide biosynthesis